MYLYVAENTEKGWFNTQFNLFNMNPLRTFALSVSAHPYCARNSLRNAMPRHTLSVHAVEEIRRRIALVDT